MATMTAPRTLAETNAGDVDQLNALLRGELSAVETYNQAMTKFDDSAIVGELSRLRDEHAQAVGELRSRVIGVGGIPSGGSGVWGSFARTVTGTAKLLGPQTVLMALREGEEIGYSDYEKTLERDDVSELCKELIRDDLIGRTQQHILRLNNLIERLD